MILEQIDPPANIDDFDDAQRQRWSQFLSDQIDANIRDFDLQQFYNPTRVATADDVQSKVIDWTAFPKNLQVAAPSDRARWRAADSSRHVQDEYCEWNVERDPNTDTITRVTFTSEGPEYWRFLANTNRDKLLQLYRKLVSPNVQLSDLLTFTGRYNPTNRWNSSTTGGNIVHLIHTNNTLGAFVNIGARATIVRMIGGNILTGELELIRCGRYGGEARHSDPHIGGEVNALARLKADITLANPMGLYIHGLFPAGWETPDGSDPLDYWTIVRGTPELGLRAVYEVPPEKNFTVGDILINGDPIEFGAQMTDFIKIKLVGLACRFGQSQAAPVTHCDGEGSFAGVAIADADLADEEESPQRG
jgi:hypothetical protein